MTPVTGNIYLRSKNEDSQGPDGAVIKNLTFIHVDGESENFVQAGGHLALTISKPATAFINELVSSKKYKVTIEEVSSE